MKALQILQYGGKEAVKFNGDAPKPVAGKGQVLLEVSAASINPIDWKIRAGYLKANLSLTMPATFGTLNVSAIHNYNSGEAYGASGVIDATGRHANFRFDGAPPNPGYTLSRIGDQHTYWFTDRDAFRTDDFHRTDLAINYGLPIWRVELFAQAEVLNLFDNDAVVDPNTTVATRRSTSTGCGPEGKTRCEAFNPFTTTPVEGVHWAKSTDFGQPTGEGSYQDPFEYRFSLGLRF